MTTPSKAPRCVCGHPRSLHVHKPSPLHSREQPRLGFCRSRQSCTCAHYREASQ